MSTVEQLLTAHPICTPKTATRTGRLDIPAWVTYDTMKMKWVIQPDPIDLEHNDDTVYWDLSKVYSASWGGVIETVYIKFETGPGILDPNKGPHDTITLDTTTPGSEQLIGDKSKDGINYIGCYTYNLWVKVKGIQTPTKVFPIDPQIDNATRPPGDEGL